MSTITKTKKIQVVIETEECSVPGRTTNEDGEWDYIPSWKASVEMFGNVVAESDYLKLFKTETAAIKSAEKNLASGIRN